MKRKAIIYGLLVVLFLLGFLLGTLATAAGAQDIQASTVLWTKQCTGDRITIARGFWVRCVVDQPTATPRLTPTPAPTEPHAGPLPPVVCGVDPDYWTSCPPTEIPYP